MLNKIGESCSSSDLVFCDSCKIGKFSQLPFSSHDITVTTPLELIYSNLWGPAPVVSVQGFRYYIIFVDAYTRYTWIYPLKLKFDALSIFTTFHKFAEIQFQSKLRALQTDNGGEFKAFLPYLHANGIQLRFTCPHTH